MPASTRSPVEGWIVRASGLVGFVKGCFHPLPRIRFTPRVVGGRKLWDPRHALTLLGEAAPRLVGVDPCAGRPSGLAGGTDVEFVDPLHASAELSTCTRPVCRAAASLARLLEAEAGVEVGVTGGLAYNPEGAGDIDLVVYGQREADTVYEVLRSLRRRGVTAPAPPEGHGWSSLDRMLGGMLAGSRVLIGLYRGFEYNVKLVPCTSPARCVRVRAAGRGMVRGRVCAASGHTVPAYYLVCGRDGEAVVLSYRLRYTEIPEGSTVEVAGRVEEWCGGRYLVPDLDGYVKLLSLPGT